MDAAFWAGRRVFLTGHTGFKGAWLALWLARLGARVSGYSLEPPTVPSLFETARVGEFVQTTIADIRDAEGLRASLSAASPEIVFHLAAQSLVRPSYEDPIGTYATNVMGTVHLLDAARSAPSARAVVVVTSDKCYENREWPWGYRENEPMGGHDPYSSSKGCAELVTAAWRRSFCGARGPRLASARAGNVIGGGDWAVDRIVPDMVRAFGDGRPVRVRNPGAIRPWQHVLEPLSGYLMLARRLCAEDGGEFAQGWNFGPRDEDAQPVSALVEKAARRWGPAAAWTADPGPHPHEAGYLKLDCSLARARLGWRPRLDLDTALEWTIDWHRARLSGNADMRSVCEQQIDAYERLPT